MNKLIIGCTGIFLLFATHCKAGLIDFETTASGGLPTDNATIEFTDLFMAGSVAVRFGFDSDLDGVLDTKAVFEEVGNVDINGDTGFARPSSPRDTAADGYTAQLGQFFLRQYDPYTPFGVFTILYNSLNPVTEASGEIWDIDGRNRATERFLVQAFDGNTLLESIESPLGNNKSLDGKPWVFGFSGLSNITKIEITFTGTKTKGIGLAFNNFSPVEDISPTANVPEPTSLSLLFACGLLVLVRRKQNKPTN